MLAFRAGIKGKAISGTGQSKKKINRQKWWAKDYRHWTEEDWKKVLWTNELKIEVFESHRRTFVRRRKTEKILEESLLPCDKGNMIVWASFGAGKVEDLFRVKGILKKDDYHSILQHHAIPCLRCLIGASFIHNRTDLFSCYIFERIEIELKEGI